MGSFLDKAHIRDLVQSESLEELPAEFSQLAYCHLIKHVPIQLMATTSIIDWNQVHHKALDWTNSSDDEVAMWSKDTLAGKCLLGLLFYSETDPCVLGPFEFMIRNFDTLIWGYPGCKLLFGVDKSENGTLIFSDGIIETDGNTHLFATLAKPI